MEICLVSHSGLNFCPPIPPADALCCSMLQPFCLLPLCQTQVTGRTGAPRGNWNMSYRKTFPTAAVQPLSDWDWGALGDVTRES